VTTPLLAIRLRLIRVRADVLEAILTSQD
jgi:hypothetical protein